MRITGTGSADVARWEVLIAPVVGGVAGDPDPPDRGDGPLRLDLVEGDHGRRQARAGRRLPRDAAAPRRRGERGRHVVAGGRRRHAARGHGHRRRGGGLARRRRDRRHRAASLDVGRARDAGPCASVRGTAVIRSWPVDGTSGAVTWNGRDAAGRTVAGRPLHRGRLGRGPPRQPGLGRSPPRRRPHGRRAPVGSHGLLPAGRRRASCRRRPSRFASPGRHASRCACSTRPARRSGWRGATAPSRPGPPRGAGTAGRPTGRGRRRVATSPSSTAVGTVRHDGPAAIGRRRRLRRQACHDHAAGRKPLHSHVPQRRSPRGPPGGDLPPGRRSPCADGDHAPLRQRVAGDRHGGRRGARARHGDAPGAGHGRRQEPDHARRHGPVDGAPTTLGAMIASMALRLRPPALPKPPRRPAPAPGSSCPPTTRRRTSATIAAAILAALPAATLLVVDDGSPDGTGQLADGLAAADPRVRVLHRAAKAGLGRAYLAGFRVALDGGAERDHPDGRRLVPRPGGDARPCSLPS